MPAARLLLSLCRDVEESEVQVVGAQLHVAHCVDVGDRGPEWPFNSSLPANRTLQFLEGVDGLTPRPGQNPSLHG